jgi:hypothetical protein
MEQLFFRVEGLDGKGPYTTYTSLKQIIDDWDSNILHPSPWEDPGLSHIWKILPFEKYCFGFISLSQYRKWFPKSRAMENADSLELGYVNVYLVPSFYCEYSRRQAIAHKEYMNLIDQLPLMTDTNVYPTFEV